MNKQSFHTQAQKDSKNRKYLQRQHATDVISWTRNIHIAFPRHDKKNKYKCVCFSYSDKSEEAEIKRIKNISWLRNAEGGGGV